MGSAEVVGHNITNINNKDIPFLRRKIGIIFQDFELFYDRTVAENFTFVMKATGWKETAKMKGRNCRGFDESRIGDDCL